MAPLVFQAPEGPAVGPGCFVRPWAAAAARPTGPSGALHTGGAWSLMCGSARRLVVRPGPATAHGHRSQALRCPPVPSTPVVLAPIASQFRMQFPDACSLRLHEMPGISTIAS